MSEFYKLIQKNDWGSVTFTVNGEPYVFKSTETVLFPDGTEKRVKVFLVGEAVYEWDHGHQSCSTSWIPYAKLKVYGLTIKIPLVDLKIKRGRNNGRYVKAS